jgi:hypothetical protein
LFRLVVGYRRHDDDILALFPIHRRRHFVFRGELNGIEYAQDFIEIPAGAHRITQHQFDFLVRPNNKHSSDRRIVCGGAAFRRRPFVSGEHVIEFGDFEVWVSDHRIIHFVTLRFLDVRGPLSVTSHGVYAQPDNLAVSFCKFGLQTSHISEFRRADGCEIFWMRKQNRPPIADPLMEIDCALSCFGREVRRLVIYAQGHGSSPVVDSEK